MVARVNRRNDFISSVFVETTFINCYSSLNMTGFLVKLKLVIIKSWSWCSFSLCSLS